MIVARCVVIVCCVGVCQCGRIEGEDSLGVYPLGNEELGGGFETGENLSDISVTPGRKVQEEVTEDGNEYSFPHEGSKNSRSGYLHTEGLERIVRPVVYSFSSTTEPRVHGGDNSQVSTLLQGRPARVLKETERPRSLKRRLHRAPEASYAFGPTVQYARLLPKITTKAPAVEKNQTENHYFEERPTQRVVEDEEEDEGGEEKEEDEESDESGSEEVSSVEREENEKEDYQESSEGSEEQGDVSMVVEPQFKFQEFFDNCVPLKNESEPKSFKDDSQRNNRVFNFSKPINQLVPYPKEHQIIESGIDKILQEPLMFFYREDLSPSESANKNHHEGGFEKGGGSEDHYKHHLSRGEKSDERYKSFHEYDKGLKGHHDKEAKEEKLNDHKGEKAKHKDTGGHFKVKKLQEKGKKGAKYEEKGAHKKGHSTKGEHVIHKKNEYVKEHEFYDEHHDGGEHEKHGGYHEKHGEKHGGKYRTGHKQTEYDEGHHGKKGHHKKGGHDDEHRGHNKKSGHKEHHEHKEEYGKDDGHEEEKKWRFHNENS